MGIREKRREEEEGGGKTDHGIPTFNWFCMVMKLENIPSIVAALAIVIMSQTFNWASGQW